ncbi:MAG: hypothetical protein FWH54_02410 [Methanobrevibacter sp.]|nr:hypothetical protein [Methanobrevibacter sp.]
MDGKYPSQEDYWINTDFIDINNKNKVLRLLKIIGIDTRYISYTPNTIYINNVRFSKFSKNREETFKKYFPEIEIIRSTIFQKICARSSKILSDRLNPKDNILLLKPQSKIDELLEIVLEPYLRKYGITIFESNFTSMDEAISKLNYDSSINENKNISKNENKDISINEKKNINAIASSLTLNEEVESILSAIFSGNEIKNDKLENNDKNNNIIIYPFINVSNEWINLFFENLSDNNFNFKNNENKKIKLNNINNYNNILNYENNSKTIANSFMEFLDELVPQYKENILKSANFIEKFSR